MNGGPRIAIDAWGGGSGSAAMIAAASKALKKDPALQFLIYGDEAEVHARLERQSNLGSGVTIVHSPESIGGHDKPSQAIRRARTTSMGMAIKAVKDRLADAAVARGNTGARMATSKLPLRTTAGIDRPARAAPLPTPAK